MASRATTATTARPGHRRCTASGPEASWSVVAQPDSRVRRDNVAFERSAGQQDSGTGWHANRQVREVDEAGEPRVSPEVQHTGAGLDPRQRAITEGRVLAAQPECLAVESEN